MSTEPDRYAGLWRKSSRSGNTGQCVEVAVANAAVGVRDTKDPDGGTLHIPNSMWQAFMTSIKNC